MVQVNDVQARVRLPSPPHPMVGRFKFFSSHIDLLRGNGVSVCACVLFDQWSLGTCPEEEEREEKREGKGV
ncbi:hypothetical protein Bpfe_023271, partial [Biomphalaria pfeifferi]